MFSPKKLRSMFRFCLQELIFHPVSLKNNILSVSNYDLSRVKRSVKTVDKE